MTQTVSVWVLLLAALCAANLPFLSKRFLLVIGLAHGKPLAIRLFELVFYYFAVGAFGMALENSAGQVAPQGWEFYAITGTLFLTFAFPGFTARYLLKWRAD